MFRSLRTLLVLIQALRLISPLLSRGRRLSLPLLLRELTVLAVANSDVVWKFLEKRNVSTESLKKILTVVKK